MEKLYKTAKCAVKAKDEIGELATRVNTLYASLLSTIEKLEEDMIDFELPNKVDNYDFHYEFVPESE